MRVRSKIFPLSLLVVFGIAVGSVILADAQQGQLPKGGEKCRKRISGGMTKYYKGAIKLYAACHKKQMKGDLPAQPTLDCNDTSTWLAGGYDKGIAKLDKLGLTSFSKLGAKCDKDTSGSVPFDLGFEVCPSPCDTTVPAVVDFYDVADCIECMSDHHLGLMMVEAYGVPPLLDTTEDRGAANCQNRIGSELGKYGAKRFGLQSKCQFNKDRLKVGWTTIDCINLEDPNHPYYDKMLKAAEKMAASLARHCGESGDITPLDSCSDNVSSLQNCTLSEGDFLVDSLATAMFPTVPPPTATMTATPVPTSTATPVPPGRACTSDAQCQTGVCSVDGVCCDSLCGSTCESCIGAKTGGDDGTCLAITVGTDPDGDCDDGNECTDDVCDGAGSCQNPASFAGTSCGDGTDNECTSPDTCDGAGNCLDNHAVSGSSCGDGGDECSIQDTCDGSGSCVDNGFESAGTSCGAPGTECSNQDTCDGFGTCLENDLSAGTSCGDPETQCTIGDTCDGSGACTDNGFQPLGTTCGSGATECSGQDTCNGAGVCLANHVTSGATCGDDGDECTVQDTCDGDGRCTDNGFISAGTTCGAGPNECSNQDTCDGSGTCQTNDIAAGTSCGDAGDECTIQDTCDGSGACTDNGFIAAGTSCGDAGDECTIQDTCDGSGTCSDNGFLPSGTNCGDAGTECTVQDTCDGSGECTDNGFVSTGTTCGDAATECSGQDTCDGAGSCQLNDLSSGTSCGDTGTECIVQDTCDGSGACTDNGFITSGTTCGDEATECSGQDTCDGAGTCLVNDLSLGTLCGDDGDECTVQDTCDGSGSCSDNGFQPAGTSCGSALETECTEADTCDGAGECLANNAVEGAACGDEGSECTVQDTCDGDGACTDNGFISAGTTCGDPSDTECTDPDTCDGSGTCETNHVAAETNCGDAGDECTFQDKCDGSGACTDNGYRAAGSLCGDASDTECTNPDTCDGSGTCQDNHEVLNTPCGDDGTECINQDTCDGTGSCTDNGFASAGASCGDSSNTECSDPDTCDGAGTCLGNHETSGTSCGDAGDQCTNQDTCDGSGECTDNGYPAPGTACGDASDTECTDPDTCNGSGTCQPNNALYGTLCGDAGSACVVQDFCSNDGICLNQGFVTAGAPCADDGNECTDDECDGAGTCLHENNVSPCDDGVFCNGTDQCSDGTCGVHTGDPCPGVDGDTNCSEQCNEATDSCTAPDPVGSPCDDGLFCTGTEVCDASGACVSSGNPCPNGGHYGGDDDSNCQESCDELTNTCTEADPDGTPCNDELFCTGGDYGDPCSVDGDCFTGSCLSICEGAPDQGTICLTDGDCPSGGTCTAKACGPVEFQKDVGAVLTDISIDQDRCVAGQCRGGAPPCPGDPYDEFGRGIALSEACDDACDEGSESCTAVVPDLTDPNDPNSAPVSCNDDDYCNGDVDICSGGVCARSGDPCEVAGFFVGDTDGTLDDDCSETCNDTTACSGVGCIAVGDCTANDVAGSQCDDGLFCNGDFNANGATNYDRCDGNGNCSVHSGDPCPGLGFDVGDFDNDCSETCNEATNDCTANDVADSLCDDGLFCNGDRQANGSTNYDRCDGAGSCSRHSGDPCPGLGFDVGDFDGDCSETCNEAANDCTANDPVNSTCDDGLFCNGDEQANGASNYDQCDGAGNCSLHSGDPCPGLGFDVGDADIDCSETCNESANNCTADDQAGTSCDDGLACTITDTCNGSGTCGGTGDPCQGLLDDGSNIDCTEGCVESGGTYSCTGNSPVTTPCDDGQFCSVTSECNGSGTCVGGSATPCDSLVDNSSTGCLDYCDEANDDCSDPEPVGSSCTDGLFCTETDTCNAVGVCVGSGDPCDHLEGNASCQDACNEATDDCSEDEADDVACDDGNICTINETCNGSGTCTDGVDPCAANINDTSNDDCRGACNTVTGECDAPEPNNTDCEDGQFCTLGDKCISGTCTGGGGDPCAANIDNEATGCEDACNEVTNDCTADEPSGGDCTDGLFCTLNDTCNASGTCVGSGDPCAANINNSSTGCSDACNEGTDDCTAPEAENNNCTDGLFCTQTDKCNSSGVCVGTGDPCPGPDGDSDCTETCNESSDACNGRDTNGSSCTDNNVCTINDSCSNGSCTGSNPCPGADDDGDCTETCRAVGASYDCNGNDPDFSQCDGSSNGVKVCKSGSCKGNCGGSDKTYRFRIYSTSSGSVDSAEWHCSNADKQLQFREGSGSYSNISCTGGSERLAFKSSGNCYIYVATPAGPIDDFTQDKWKLNERVGWSSCSLNCLTNDEMRCDGTAAIKSCGSNKPHCTVGTSVDGGSNYSVMKISCSE